MKLKHQKHLFDIPEDITYLNIASQSPAFKSIYEAGIKGLIQKNHPYNITNSDYFEPVIELKKLFAELVNVDNYERIATIPSVSYGIATVVKNITLKPGDEIVLIDEQFPSNFYSWQKLAETYSATIKTVSAPDSKTNRNQLWNEAILNTITEKTALVAMGNVHWSNGCLFDLKSIREKTKKCNALLIIDGSQSVGALPFSVEDLQPDALICAGYKWLFGPYGCGYAYFGPYFDNGLAIEENWSNRLDSENFTGLTNYQPKYKPFANRYCVGQSGNFIYVQMQIAALKQIIKWTPEAIQNYCKEITQEAVTELLNLGCKIEDGNYRTHHMFGVELPSNLDIDSLKQKLKEENIFISFRGKYIRLSCHLYNTKEDFTKLTACISACL